MGAGALTVDFGVLIALTELASWPYLAAAALAFVLGLTVNYLLAIRYVFRRRPRRARSAEFVLYGSVGVVGLGLTELSLWLLTDGLGLHYTLAKAMTAVFVFLCNFLLRRYLMTAKPE